MAHTQRNGEYLQSLAQFLQQKYGMGAVEITPAPRGYYGETWRADTTGGRFFVKIDYHARHQEKYRNGLRIVNYLCNNGIGFVGRVVKTTTGALCAPFRTGLLGVFAWVDGVNTETDATKIPEYRMLAKIYSLTKPGLGIPKATFSADTAEAVFQKWNALQSQPAGENGRAVLSLLEKHREMLRARSARLAHFAALCQKDHSHFYLTHGDAGGNLLASGDGRYTIIDWDEGMVAPPGRDAWVMGCHAWAREAFTAALQQSGIEYALRPERLAFYCYHMFFLYLSEFLDDFPALGGKQVEDYFNGWIEERMRYADSL